MNFDYDFLKQIILILIPTFAGAFTSKFVMDSWQSRKEKNDIKRQILSEYDNYVPKTWSLIATFLAISIRKIKKSPKDEDPELCDKFIYEYWELSYAGNQLLRSLRLYYENKNLTLEFSFRTIIEDFGEIYNHCEAYINSSERNFMINEKQLAEDLLKKILEKMKELEMKLITEKLIIR
jgi:hypothetical protein